MPPIVINKSHGEFCLSHLAFLRLRELGQQDARKEADPAPYWPLAASPQEPDFNQYGRLIPRDDLKLAQVVTELGGKANGYCAELKVVDVPSLGLSKDRTGLASLPAPPSHPGTAVARCKFAA
nr:hypothetical protein [Nitrospirota bacterium]